MVVPPAVHIAATPTVPCSAGYPARVRLAVPASARVADAVAAPEDTGPVLDRSASISLARPVSISSAPAPTVTMTAAGTPILATCHPRPRPRRAGGAGGRRADHGVRRVAASATDPCQARNSSSD